MYIMQSETNLSTKDFKFKMYLTYQLKETTYILKYISVFTLETLLWYEVYICLHLGNFSHTCNHIILPGRFIRRKVYFQQDSPASTGQILKSSLDSWFPCSYQPDHYAWNGHLLKSGWTYGWYPWLPHS